MSIILARPFLYNVNVINYKNMNKLKTILKLLFSKEYYLVTVKRDGDILVQHIHSSVRRTETTYKKLIKLLKDELTIIRQNKYEQ